MKPLRVLSLFDGISTGQYCLEQVGIPIEVYYASEIEQSTIDITQYKYPKTVQLGDVTQIDFKQFEGKIDLLIGGSPCVSLSITTGKNRTNLDGQSKLFFDFVRALEEVKPRYFFLENVASMNNESKDIMSQYMGCKPQLIDAGIFSAQERERLYWFNFGNMYKNMLGHKSWRVKLPESKGLVLKDILEENPAEKYYYKQTFDFYGLDKSVCANLHINGHDIIKRVQSPYFKCHTLTCCRGGNLQKKVFDIERNQCRKLTPLEYERLQGLPDFYTKYSIKGEVSDSARYNACGNGWEANTIIWIFKALKEELEREEYVDSTCQVH